MRYVVMSMLISSAVVAQAQTELEPTPVGTMSELMIKVIYPTSDAILYVSTRTPTNEVEWNELQGKALMLAESANLLMMPGRAWDEDQWMRDSRLMLDAGIAAFNAAMDKDLDALIEVNEPLHQSCVICHRHYRPDYLKDARLKLQDPPE